MQPRGVRAQEPRDAFARGKDIGCDLDAQAGDALEKQGRMAPLLRELPDHRGDVLVGGDFLLHHQHVIGVLAFVPLEEAVKVLPVGVRRAHHVRRAWLVSE